MEKRAKLQPSSERNIHVGYNKNSKAYRVFLTYHEKKVLSWHVEFGENLASKKYQDLPTIAEGPQEEEPKEKLRAKTSSNRDSQPSM